MGIDTGTFSVFLKEYVEGGLRFCSCEVWIRIQEQKGVICEAFKYCWLIQQGHVCLWTLGSPELAAVQSALAYPLLEPVCQITKRWNPKNISITHSQSRYGTCRALKNPWCAGCCQENKCPIYLLEVPWKVLEYFGPLGYVRDRQGHMGLKIWQMWWPSVSSAVGQFCPAQSGLNSLSGPPSLSNLIQEEWSSALVYSWGHPWGSV